MKFKFVKVKASYNRCKPIEYWALFIENLEDFKYYIDQVSPKFGQAYLDVKKKNMVVIAQMIFKEQLRCVFLKQTQKENIYLMI